MAERPDTGRSRFFCNLSVVCGVCYNRIRGLRSFLSLTKCTPKVPLEGIAYEKKLFGVPLSSWHCSLQAPCQGTHTIRNPIMVGVRIIIEGVYASAQDGRMGSMVVGLARLS